MDEVEASAFFGSSLSDAATCALDLLNWLITEEVPELCRPYISGTDDLDEMTDDSDWDMES